MNRRMNSEDELQDLRTLCDTATTGARRHELLESLRGHGFVEPEHQVVFESVSFLSLHGGVSEARLATHLNNRGFPDVDLERYFPPARAKEAPQKCSGRENT